MRLSSRLAVVALLGCAASASAQDALPAHRARMYPRPAQEVWQAAQDTLTALGMKTEEMDAEHQLVVTKFRAYGSKTVAGPQVPGYRANRFQLHVFVSPFAEPARVHVGSLTELEKMAGGTATLYSSGEAEGWFLDALDRKLGVPGRAIPIDPTARFKQAEDLGGHPCRAAAAAGGDLEEPVKIKASEVKVLYPAGAAANAIKGVVVLQFAIGEDGGIYGTTVAESSAPDRQFRHSALGAASLLRYVPTRVKGCPTVTVTTYTFNYALARRGR